MKILNFGSLNIDHVYKVDHFPQPGETLASLDYSVHIGGKGLNQSIALKKAGADVYHAGAVGKDGAMLLAFLQEHHVHTDFIEELTIPSGHAMIEVDKQGQNSILLYSGANKRMTQKQCDKVLAHFESGDLLVIQNEINCMDYIIQQAYARGMRIAFNPSPIDQTIFTLPLHLVEWLILNETEGIALAQCETSDQIVDQLIKIYPNTKIVLTLGEKGVLYGEGEKRIYQQACKCNVVDTTAAGDTFSGYFLYGISIDMSVEKALALANKAAAITISHMGASEAIPLMREVEQTA